MDVVRNLIFTFDLGFWSFGLVSPFLPLAFVWRSAVLAILCFLAKDLLVGSIAPLNIAHVVGQAVEMLLLSAIAIGVAIRFAIAAALRHLTFETLHLGHETGHYRWIDYLIMVLLGGIVGFCATKAIASELGGSGGGVMLDIGIALAMAALAAILALWRPRYVWMPLGASFAVSAVMALYGAGQTQRIIDGAETLAAGRAWCLIAAGTRKKIPDIEDLGFFSLGKNNDGARLLVIVRDKDALVRADWSIRRQRFNASDRRAYEGCSPRPDHGQGLRDKT